MLSLPQYTSRKLLTGCLVICAWIVLAIPCREKVPSGVLRLEAVASTHSQSQVSGAWRGQPVRRKRQAAPAETDTETESAEELAEEANREMARELDEMKRQRRPDDQPGEAAEFYRRKRVPPGEQAIPVERYLAAREQMRQMRHYSTANNLTLPSSKEANQMEAAAQLGLGAWTPLGPGNVGGRTRALLIHPTNPQVMYAAGVAGGVWKTTNGGAAWASLSDMIANLAVCALAMDPKNPEVLYAGTGEGFFNQDGLRGAGIFKTTDGGGTWTHLASTSAKDFYYVNDIVISPASSQRVYAATDTGVWRSDDGGLNWMQSLKAAEEQPGGCLDLAVRTDQLTDYLFASFSTFRQATVYRNTDAGGSGEWVAVLSEPGMQRTSLALAPANQNVIYALSTGQVEGTLEGNGLRGVFRSTSSGDPGSWTTQVQGADPIKLNRLLLANPIIATLSECGFGKSFFYNQGWYDNVIAVDPADADRVWVGGTDLFRSDDGGKNWGLASHWWANDSVPQYAHADQHTIVFHPQYDGLSNKTMFVSNDGGIFRTDDARAAVATGETATCRPSNSGVHWVALNHNYGVTQFYHGLPFPDGTRYFGGTQDNGTQLGTDAQGLNGWREIQDGDGGYVAIDPTHPNVLYAEYTGLSLRKSTNGGQTFSDAIFGIDFGLSLESGLFITPFAMDPSNPQRLWTGGVSMWRTNDGAAHWNEVGHKLSVSDGPLSAIAIAPTDSNYVIVGRETGLIQRTSKALQINTGNSHLADALDPDVPWAASNFIPNEQGYISWVTFDPADKNIAYATSSSFRAKHVWKSVDAGASWRPLDGEGPQGFPDVPAHCIVVDPNNTARLYLGTDLGVFVTLDGGATWAVENSGFANVIVEALAVNTVNGVTSLYAFTHGRGAWRVTLGSGCQPPVFNPAQTFSAAGGEGRLEVASSPDGCPWQVMSNTEWITILDGGSGQGSGAIRFTIAPNNIYEKRIGTVTVGRRNFSVTQEPATDTTPPQAAFVSPISTGGTITVTTGYVNLAWKVTDNNAVTYMELDRNGGIANLPAFGKKLPENFSMDRASLQLGVNTFTVFVRDAAGYTATASIKVIFAPEYLITTIAGSGEQGFAGDGGPARQAKLWNPAGATRDRAGNLYIADLSNGRIRRVDFETSVITTVAGKGYPEGVFASGDGGPALDAVLAGPTDVKVDAAGNLYVAERGRIRKITLDGKIKTIAGDGTNGFSGDGGPGTAAKISGSDIALDAAGNLYLSDTDNHRVRKIAATTGIIATIAGNGVAGFGGDGGPATAAQLNTPYSLAFDTAGNLYLADSGNHRIRQIAADTGIISTVAGDGRGDYTFEDNVPTLSTPLPSPYGVAVDGSGNLYVSIFGRIRRISTDGRIRTIAGTGDYHDYGDDGVPAVQSPVGTPRLEADAAGNIFFAASFSQRVRQIYPLRLANGAPSVTITAPSATGSYTTTQRLTGFSGTASSNGTIAQVYWSNDRGGYGQAAGTTSWNIIELPLMSGLNRITITAEDPVGNSGSAVINVTLNPEYVVQRFAGDPRFQIGFGGDGGLGSVAPLWEPRDVAADTAGNLFIADTGNHRIRKVALDGTITTYAGNGSVGSSGDGGLAINAELNQPRGVACDADGNLYIADTLNNRIRRVSLNGLINTIAGDGVEDIGGDGGPATEAHLARPRGLALDAAGNLFIADTGNHRVRRVDAKSGMITTVAGNGTEGFSGDGGPATQAALDAPQDVAVDRHGNLFVADGFNHRIRKVNAAGTISTFAGNENTPGTGRSALEPLFAFSSVTVDPAGNVYVTSEGIQRLTPDGNSSLVAGQVQGQLGIYETSDGGPSTGVTFYRSQGLTFDRAGNLYVADSFEHRVWMISEYQAAANVSAASYIGPEVSSESIVTVFGNNLATSAQPATALPLPTMLAGTTIKVRDRAGRERLAPLFYVSPSQINYQIPPGTAPGPALVTITNSAGTVFTSAAQIVSAAPGLFTATADGQGLAAAVAIRFKADGAQSYEAVTRYDAAQQKVVAIPIDLGGATDQVFLELYGTGVRYRSALAQVTAQIGGEAAEVLYAGAQGGFAGLDQINVRVPRKVAGRGEVDIVLMIDGQAANTIKVNIK